MTKIVSTVAAAVALATVGVALASSANTVHNYKSALAPGAEVPKPKAPATAKGRFTATVTESGNVRTIRWILTFRGLSGNAGAAHIHKGGAGVSGAVLLSLCGPCKTGQTGQAKITTAVADALERGLAYVNVHTAKNAAGEIRGQVKILDQAAGQPSPAPGPATTTPGAGYGDPAAGY